MPTSYRNNQGNLPKSLQLAAQILSGEDLSDVRVHYSSMKPHSIQAYAYTQGIDIYLAPGWDQHLAHEVWHVVQQKQGRVAGLKSVGGLPLNDDEELEREAEIMGVKLLQLAAQLSARGSILASLTGHSRGW